MEPKGLIQEGVGEGLARGVGETVIVSFSLTPLVNDDWHKVGVAQGFVDRPRQQACGGVTASWKDTKYSVNGMIEAGGCITNDKIQDNISNLRFQIK